MTYESIEAMIELLGNENADFMDQTIEESISFPSPISAIEYLSFAEQDLAEKSDRSAINALSNAKRSLDCRIEEILHGIGMLAVSKKKKWNVPRKIEYLSSLGIITPRILTKLNKERNLLEHEFHWPDAGKVEDFVDVVALFNESTKIFIFNLPNDCRIVPEISLEVMGFSFSINRDLPCIYAGKFSLTIDHDNYEQFAAGYARILFRQYT